MSPINLRTATRDEIEDYRNLLWSELSNIDHEISRRDALPHIHPQQVSMIQTYRAIIGSDSIISDPQPWEPPQNELTSYVQGDRVLHNDEEWIATGAGAIMTPPGETDPIQGEVWRLASQLESEDNEGVISV